MVSKYRNILIILTFDGSTISLYWLADVQYSKDNKIIKIIHLFTLAEKNGAIVFTINYSEMKLKYFL